MKRERSGLGALPTVFQPLTTVAVACCVVFGMQLMAEEVSRGISGKVEISLDGQPMVVHEESCALVVGINRCPDGSAFRSLTFGVSDAEKMRELLVKTYGFTLENVILLTDKNRAEADAAGRCAGFDRACEGCQQTCEGSVLFLRPRPDGRDLARQSRFSGSL